jgi:oligopeptide transport system substrate-binding protein
MKTFLAILFSFSFTFGSTAKAVILKARLSEDPKILDWNGQAFPGAEADIIDQLEQGLYGYRYPGNQLVPVLAERAEISKDHLEYHFLIRTDARWSDGRPVFAQDFIDSWLRLLSPQSTSVYANYLSDIKNAVEYRQGKFSDPDQVGIHAINDHELRVQLKRPIRNWMSNTAFYPMFPIRKDLILKYGTNWIRAGVLLSSGPFVLESYEAGKEIHLKRNPYFKFVPHSNITEVVFQIVPDAEKAFQLYLSGGFSFLTGLANGLGQKIISRKDVHRISVHRLHLLSLNYKKFPLTNPKFRAAVADALKPTEILPPQSPTFRVFPSFVPALDADFSAYHPDRTRSKTEYKESGVVIGKKNLQLLAYPAPFSMAVANRVAAQIQSVLGIGVDITGGPDYMTLRNLGQYDLVYHSWTPKTKTDYESLENFSSDSTHDQKIQNAFFNDAVEAAKTAVTDTDERKFLHEGEKILADKEHLILPLFVEDDLYLQSAKVKGLNFTQMGGMILKDIHLAP